MKTNNISIKNILVKTVENGTNADDDRLYNNSHYFCFSRNIRQIAAIFTAINNKHIEKGTRKSITISLEDKLHRQILGTKDINVYIPKGEISKSYTVAFPIDYLDLEDQQVLRLTIRNTKTNRLIGAFTMRMYEDLEIDATESEEIDEFERLLQEFISSQALRIRQFRRF